MALFLIKPFGRRRMTLLEKVRFRFPKLANIIYGFIKKKKNSVRNDMLLCTGVSLASAFYEFEAFFPPAAVDIIKNLLIFLTVCCWVWCAFLNGFWKKYSFLVFMFLFWLIPRIIIFWEENTGIRNYSKYLDAAAQFSRLISQYSLSGLSRFLNTPLSYVMPALLIWCLLFYIIGRAAEKRLKRIAKTLAKE